MPSLLGGPPRVVNIGLAGFARDLAGNGVPVVQVDWRPPSKFASLLAPRVAAIARANDEALARILAADPWLVGVRRAGELVPALEGERLILHAGPPLAWARMCGPLRGAVCGAIVYEGWAPELAEAEQLAERGGVRFAPNHHHGCVGPMTGITTRSQPLLVVENRSQGNRALCAINEGLGKVMRFGGNDAEVLARLAWLRDELAPLLDAALRACSGIPLNPLIARGLAMGDEMHQRNVACTSLLLRTLAPHLARAATAPALPRALEFIAGNDQFFLNVAMAMAKSMLDPAQGIAECTLVTAMARNGTDFGIRVSAPASRARRSAASSRRWLLLPMLANRVERGRYLDSVALMRIARRLGELPGVEGAALMIGTPSNKALLADARLLSSQGEAAQPNDLVIAVRAADPGPALELASRLLAEPAVEQAERLRRTRTLEAALALEPQANLALISVPGEFAAAEARKALERESHAMVYSDNVPLEYELALKRYAAGRGLLLMGPDCGTALIGGAPLAFANAVPRGDIGIVSASGTGLQEVSCLIARLGGGVSHGIGVGGRDLDERVDALGMLAAIDVLEADALTRTLVLISKPPAPRVAQLVMERVRKSPKRSVVCFLGLENMTLTAVAEQAMQKTLPATPMS